MTTTIEEYGDDDDNDDNDVVMIWEAGKKYSNQPTSLFVTLVSLITRMKIKVPHNDCFHNSIAGNSLIHGADR